MDKPHQIIWDQIAEGYHDLSTSSLPHLDKNVILAQIILDCNPKNILNLGCGSGVLERQLFDLGYTGSITAVDGSSEMLKIARRNDFPNVTYVQAELEKTDLKNIIQKSPDLVVMANVFFLLQNKKSILKEISEILSKGGKFILIEPKPKGNILFFIFYHIFGVHQAKSKESGIKLPFSRRLKNYFKMAFIFNQLDKMEKKGHFRYNTQEELKNLIIESGLKINRFTEIQAKQNWLIEATK